MYVCQLCRCWGPVPMSGVLFPVLEASREGGTLLRWTFYGKWSEAWGQPQEVRWGFRVNLKSPSSACTWGPGAAFREDAGFPQELQASSRPPASRGRNAKDQLSAELRLPFWGAPGAGPSPAAELTGSVCPTGRAALAKNRVLPSATCARREPGTRLWEPEPRQSKEPGEPRTPSPRAWPRSHLRGRGRGHSAVPTGAAEGRVAGPRAEAPPRPSGMGAGGAASRALAWASLPLLGPPAGALCEDTLCCRGKAGRLRARPSLFPGTCWGPFLLPLPRSAAGVQMGGGGWGDPRQPHRLVEKSQALSARSLLL